MKVLYKLFLIAPVFLLSSCLINRQRQVWLGGLQQTHNADTGSIVRIYFDKQGNLYPDKKQFIPYKNFFDPQKGKHTISETHLNGRLEMYYTSNPDKLKELSSFYKLKDETFASAKDSFYAVQKLIRQNLVERLNVKKVKDEQKTLVVMIHGFNDTDPTGDYQLIREEIRKFGHEKGQFIYLEVFWDGLTTNQGNPVYENIWGRALQNSAYVSLGLRQILSGIDQATHIRIITHSLGASVGTGAIFNTVTKWKKDGFRKVGKKLQKDYGVNYFDLQQYIATPTQNIRIGMIAPAIPGYNNFIDFNNRTPSFKNAENNINRIIAGINVNDYAVTKRFLKIDMARLFGSTSLGCNYKRKGKTELVRTTDALIKIGYSSELANQLIRPVDFSLHNRKEKDEEHGLYYYLKHGDCVNSFLKELFE